MSDAKALEATLALKERMLTDSQIQRLAEMIGDGVEIKRHIDPTTGRIKARKVYFDNALIARSEGRRPYQLTYAGYFTVIKVLDIWPQESDGDGWHVLANGVLHHGKTLEAAIDAALDYSL